MTALTHGAPRQLAIGFVAGALVMGLVTLVGTVLAQTPTPTPMPAIDVQQMIEWCRQMMTQAGGMMQGMMSGMCMMGR